ncbi:MAG: triose-phosphate isomerase [Methylophilaceae bacterium]|nr:MAG: triose-phosphate isomerase [Methylophilaceae bacterium]
MQTRKQLVVGNWKLHGNLLENERLLLAMAIDLTQLSNVDCGICLPYPYLFQAQKILADTRIGWGAQNVSQFVHGAYTASVSAEMIADFDCSYVIVGHSERRTYSHESNQTAVTRIKRAVDAAITPIYCVGETLEEHAAGQTKQMIEAQVLAIFDLDETTLSQAKAVNLVIAYEPVWAIGTGYAADPDHVQAIHSFIRRLIKQYDADFAKKVRIIYGGSLTPDNACSILTLPDIDGGLVGHSALNVLAFTQICRVASNTGACQTLTPVEIN